MTHIKKTDIPVEAVGEGVTRQIMGHTKDLMLVRVCFKKGSIGYVHKHPHHQVSFVEKGKFEVNIDGNKKILSTGDAFVIDADLEHGAVCLEEGVLIDTFAPRRDDFID